MQHDETNLLLVRARDLEHAARDLLGEVGKAVLESGRRGPKQKMSKLDGHSLVEAAICAERAAGNRQIADAAETQLLEAGRLRWDVALRWKALAWREAGPMRGHDRFQAAMIGLFDAAKRFDPDRGIKYATYARWWARAHVTRQFDEDTSLPISHAKKERLRNLGKWEAMGVGGDELLKKMGMTADELTRLRLGGIARNTTSLDALLDPEDDGPGLEPAGGEISPEVIEDHLMIQTVMEAVDLLPHREATVLRLRYGLGSDAKDELQSLGKIGARFRLSRERIRQIETQALLLLRRLLWAKNPRGGPDGKGAMLHLRKKSGGRKPRSFGEPARRGRPPEVRTPPPPVPANSIFRRPTPTASPRVSATAAVEPLAELVVVEAAAVEPDPVPAVEPKPPAPEPEPPAVKAAAVEPDPVPPVEPEPPEPATEEVVPEVVGPHAVETLTPPVSTRYALVMASPGPEQETVRWSPQAEKVLEALLRYPEGTAVALLSADTGMSPGQVSSCLRTLRNQGLARSNGQIAKASRWFSVGTSAAARAAPKPESRREMVRRAAAGNVTLLKMDHRPTDASGRPYWRICGRDPMTGRNVTLETGRWSEDDARTALRRWQTTTRCSNR